MLRADEIDALRGAAEELTAPIVDYLIQDLAKRVAKAGQLTATAQYETWKLQELGLSQREIKKQLQHTGIGTKAQQALKLQQEAGKQARNKRSRAEKAAEQERRFAQRQEKRKAKHKGH